jgi:hypothetical protein
MRKPSGARFQAQSGTPAVGRIRPSVEQPSRYKTLQDARNGARVQPDDFGKLACRDIGKLFDDAQDQSLGTGNSEVGLHALGHPLEPVLD